MNLLTVLVLSMLILVESSTATEDRTFDKKSDTNGGNLSVVFTDDTNHETADESQQAIDPRSVIQANANNPCYKQFFVGNKPPIGFKSNKNIRYICQKSGTTLCFSTMFDLNYGIPVYAAYVVKKGQVGFSVATRAGLNFRQDRGIPPNNQGSSKMYSESNKGVPNNLKIHKGHLVPAETYSFSPAHLHSTFTYTNAVPQYGKFNSGQWAQHEQKIRNYAVNVCSKKNGDLFLLTGISDMQIYLQGNKIKKFKPPGTPKRMPKKPNIVIPNSMWTAGCCVSGKNVIGSFAMIGNNDSNKMKIYMSKLPVSYLEGIIGITDLFPGNSDCDNNKYDVAI